MSLRAPLFARADSAAEHEATSAPIAQAHVTASTIHWSTTCRVTTANAR